MMSAVKRTEFRAEQGCSLVLVPNIIYDQMTLMGFTKTRPRLHNGAWKKAVAWYNCCDKVRRITYKCDEREEGDGTEKARALYRE
jgi:hypothetical protein